jgi:hypothetical protein
MKFIIHIAATMAIAAVLQSWLPWWTMAIGAFGVAYFMSNKGFASFAAGFLAVALLWLGFAFYIDVATHSILTEKINRLLPINSFVLTLLIGGLVGGFSSLTGSLLRAK